MNVFDVFGQPVWRQLVFALLHTVWQGGLIALATAAAPETATRELPGGTIRGVARRAVRGPDHGAADLGRPRDTNRRDPVDTIGRTSGGVGDFGTGAGGPRVECAQPVPEPTAVGPGWVPVVAAGWLAGVA